MAGTQLRLGSASSPAHHLRAYRPILSSRRTARQGSSVRIQTVYAALPIPAATDGRFGSLRSARRPRLARFSPWPCGDPWRLDAVLGSALRRALRPQCGSSPTLRMNRPLHFYRGIRSPPRQRCAWPSAAEFAKAIHLVRQPRVARARHAPAPRAFRSCRSPAICSRTARVTGGFE